PLAKGNAYASNIELNHASTLKMMDEIFGVAFQTNAIPGSSINAAGDGYNYVASVNDLSDLFQAPATEIATQPQSQGALVGTDVTFSVVARGTPPFTYQWRKEGTNLPSANASSLILT